MCTLHADTSDDNNIFIKVSHEYKLTEYIVRRPYNSDSSFTKPSANIAILKILGKETTIFAEQVIETRNMKPSTIHFK